MALIRASHQPPGAAVWLPQRVAAVAVATPPLECRVSPVDSFHVCDASEVGEKWGEGGRGEKRGEGGRGEGGEGGRGEKGGRRREGREGRGEKEGGGRRGGRETCTQRHLITALAGCLMHVLLPVPGCKMCTDTAQAAALTDACSLYSLCTALTSSMYSGKPSVDRASRTCSEGG